MWLDPRLPPPAGALACRRCRKPLRFLCQVYAPLEAAVAGGDAFHRALYLFCCADSACVKQGRGAVRAFRCQLPRCNGLYVGDAAAEFPDDGVASGDGAAPRSRADVGISQRQLSRRYLENWD